MSNLNLYKKATTRELEVGQKSYDTEKYHKKNYFLIKYLSTAIIGVLILGLLYLKAK